MPCKVFDPNRTKMFHVKHFGTINESSPLAVTLGNAIPRSRRDPKIPGADDAQIAGDRVAKASPVPRDLAAQEVERASENCPHVA